MRTRQHLKKPILVKINEELCNGCGLCISHSAEGSIEFVDKNEEVEVCADQRLDSEFCSIKALTLVIKKG